MTPKPCKKCGSTFIHRETDKYGTYLICGACGRTNDQDTIPMCIQETVIEQDIAEEEADIVATLGIRTQDEADIFGIILSARQPRRRQPVMSRFQ